MLADDDPLNTSLCHTSALPSRTDTDQPFSRLLSAEFPQLLLLFLVKVLVPAVIEVANVLSCDADKEPNQVLAGFVITIAQGLVTLRPAHELSLGGAEAEIQNIGLILPALVILVLVFLLYLHILRHGRRPRIRVETGCGAELVNEHLDNLERGGDLGVLIGVWKMGGSVKLVGESFQNSNRVTYSAWPLI